MCPLSLKQLINYQLICRTYSYLILIFPEIIFKKDLIGIWASSLDNLTLLYANNKG